MPKTTYVWDELSDNVIEEYEDGVLSVSYDHEPGLYGNLLSQNRNGVTSLYHYEGRGDTTLVELWCNFEEDFRNGKVPCPVASSGIIKLFDAPSLLVNKNS